MLKASFGRLARALRRAARAPRLETAFNACSQDSPRRVLFARESPRVGFAYGELLDWIPEHWPEAARWIELRTLPCDRVDWSRIGAFHAWIQDPVLERHPTTYQRLQEVEARCRQLGIPVVNPVDAMSNSVRERMNRLIAGAGLRVPRVVEIRDWSAFDELSLPIIIRPAWGHCRKLHLIRERQDLTYRIRRAFRDPVAVEYFDVRDDDNLYRKYRYMMIGSTGIAYHMLASSDWITHVATKVQASSTVAEEAEYLRQPDPHHEVLDAARQRLAFDIAAFDYGLDASGSLMVWEANPLPALPYAVFPPFSDKRRMTDRLYRALLEYYFQLAGISIGPQKIPPASRLASELRLQSSSSKPLQEQPQK